MRHDRPGDRRALIGRTEHRADAAALIAVRAVLVLDLGVVFLLFHGFCCLNSPHQSLVGLTVGHTACCLVGGVDMSSVVGALQRHVLSVGLK
jgi:hypothetical protein